MGRFGLGLVCGVLATALVTAAIWPSASQPGPSRNGVAAVAPDTAPGRRHVARDDPAGDAMENAAAPRAAIANSAAVDATTEPATGDPLADVRLAISQRQAGDARRAVQTLVSQGVLIPRAIVDELARWVPDADNPFEVRNTLQEALNTWEPQAIEALLREIQAATPGASPIESAVLPAAAIAAARGHELNALAQQLAASTDSWRQMAAATLAATSRRVDPDLVGRVFDAASDASVRAHAMRALADMIHRSAADPRTRAVAGRVALGVLRGDSSRDERESAVLVVHLAGEEGLEIALQTVLEGGLSRRREEAILAGLIEAGRLPRLLQESAGNVAIRSRTALAVFNGDEPREADVVALWPLIPELVSAMDDDAGFCPEEAAAELGRFDLVEELARDVRLPPSIRAGAVEELLVHERSDMAHGLDVATDLVFAPASGVELRRAIVDTLYDPWNRGDEGDVDRLLVLVDRIAREDPVEWVRYDAADVASFVRQMRSSR